MKSDTIKTYEDKLESLLNELDAAYVDLREIHQDKTFLNNKSKAFLKAEERFLLVSNKIFALKNAWED